jgi:hypothetical protein
MGLIHIYLGKKESCIYWISDLHQLNKVLKEDIFLYRSSWIFYVSVFKAKKFTEHDISMQKYTFDFDKESQDL